MSQKISMLLTLLVGLIVTVAGFNASAQKIIDGTWKASLDDNAKIQLNFERTSESEGQVNQKKRKHQFGQTYEFSELQGLTREQVVSGGPVRFSLDREAGRIECEGNFANSKGTGTFRFTPSHAFISGMKSRGFDFESEPPTTEEGRFEDRLFTAAALNVTTSLADDLLSANFGKLGVSDLFKAAIFKIDSKFMREMKATGFPDLGMEDLVKARIFKIDAAFVAKAGQMGFEKQSFDSLVKMSIFKITPEFLNEVRSEGLTNISLEDAVKLQIFKIDGDFIRKAKADGVPIDVERLVQRRLGVGRRSAI